MQVCDGRCRLGQGNNAHERLVLGELEQAPSLMLYNIGRIQGLLCFSALR